MKKSKKYISIIIPALALLFISSGLFFSSNLIVSAREDNELQYSVNEEDIPGTTGTAGGIPGTFRGGGSSDDSTNDDYTGDENTGDTTTKTVSDSITVLVEDPGDGDEKPVCSQNTNQCEKGTATNKKTTEGSNQFVYIWDCELDGETESCEDPMPTCGDFSYNDGSNWTGGCDGGYTAEKKYDKESNTYTWQCRGSLGDPIRECSHKPKDGLLPTCGDFSYNDGSNWTGGCDGGDTAEKKYDKESNTYTWQCRGSLGDPIQECSYKPKDGQCKYIEDYYPRSGSYNPSKIFLCEGEGVKSINHRVDNEKEIVYWDCPGEEGGKTDNCSKLIYASAICGDEPGECSKGVFVEGSFNYWSDETVQSWKCQGVNGGTPDGLYKNISTCYPDDDGGGDDNGEDIIIDGQCADKLGECLSGEKTSVTTDEKGNSYWQCLGSEKGETDYCFLEGPDEPTYPPVIPPVKDPINGVCGSSNGLFFSKEPASNLCEQGELSGKALKQENNSWAWTCAGLYGGENAKCNTMSVSLTPKMSGCYIQEGESSCEVPFEWSISGLYKSISLMFNKVETPIKDYCSSENPTRIITCVTSLGEEIPYDCCQRSE